MVKLDLASIPKQVAIIGTDTDSGKTYITGHLAAYLRQHGRVITQKWVQTGCTATVPADIEVHLAIQNQSHQIYHKWASACCPYQFAYPSSPHLAAALVNQLIDPTVIHRAFHQLKAAFDYVICESSGGLLVPITPTYTQADCIRDLKLPSILVVGNKLGCINHTLLTVATMKQQQLPLIGIIMNQVLSDDLTDPCIASDNAKIIASLSGVPILAIVPHQQF